MDNIATGKFITKKRKEQNLTQEQLAERLGVSNKTISKWETGKCMPDYSVIELLCKELNTTLAELMNGEENEKSIHTYDNEQIVEMLKEIQNLRNMKILLIGFFLLLMGSVQLALSQMFGGTDIQDFLSGLMLGISIPQMLIGVFLLGRWLVLRNGKNGGHGHEHE
ncbi:MAG: helix-turn-helix transcriptional regulator [Lachnospiraceae bacterium]|jgi:transcriptional regulator with XRE-family HTH domain|nr:helix-turn-helix transcriptional regulator [uncultured Acetatifactor sp.]MCI9221408.1 helix-turn-helix transcriptional regulator [Lachnospiraceae bacterium]